ncbi:radical SAM protein [Prosthecochloris sp. N3]|uniref:Radical SAM protein n=1 Tax=Prosthecochloris ethylica TaxID=2743976 RepID=A0ABR9XT01_9CHLB|nr:MULTISPECIES: radical SAM protein [Prosthecochloris]MBF0585564.1 radical SAM protein [Prosthecochloris ethylica]MBF0637143.1 radical SAM protein [Prosthecochloris ethylica]NUK46794.1 radical SAM protein [Prosthecochloris ethylica]RNA64628.1 radical SAM protein [Prosthecochloris sp. ZM_2]
MKYVFGPVSSKRLGQSLGVDILPPKSCTWNCIYCQLGRTKEYVTARREFFPKEDILAEIRQAVHSGAPIDWITFVGSGETTLYRHLGWLIHETKQVTDIPVAVITNGSLLSDEDVRNELLEADAVLPSLNAGSADLFNRIDRPAPGFTFERHVEGLRSFREIYNNRLWVEVMLIAGLNDSVEALQDIADILETVRPDMVHLVLPTRPSTESTVHLPHDEAVTRARLILSSVAQVVHPAKKAMNLKNTDDIISTVSAITMRHPLQERELRHALDELLPDDPDQAERMIETLLGSGRFKTLTLEDGEVYWVPVTDSRV